MAEIIFKKPEEANGTLAIGDWIIVSGSVSDQLCVIAQVDSDRSQCICVQSHEANRWSVPYKHYSTKSIGDDCIKSITSGRPWRKVNVTITVE